MVAAFGLIISVLLRRKKLKMDLNENNPLQSIIQLVIKGYFIFAGRYPVQFDFGVCVPKII